MSMDPDEILSRVEKGLWAPLPGIPAQLRMVPEPWPGQKAYFEVEDTSLKAGVLILLYKKDDRLWMLLTRRTERVLHHRGQISLPGGGTVSRRVPRGHGPPGNRGGNSGRTSCRSASLAG